MFGSLLLGIATLLGAIYAFLVSNFGHWRRRGVTEPRALPLFGSFPNMIWPRQHFTMDMRDIYMWVYAYSSVVLWSYIVYILCRHYRNTHSYVGCYLLRAPKLLVLEPRLVYEIYVSAFSHFENNDASKMVDIAKDRLVALNPFVLEGEEWRHQRAVFSTLLTNGRIRTTHAIMQRVCLDLCQFIAIKSAGGKDLDCIDVSIT